MGIQLHMDVVAKSRVDLAEKIAAFAFGSHIETDVEVDVPVRHSKRFELEPIAPRDDDSWLTGLN